MQAINYLLCQCVGKLVGLGTWGTWISWKLGQVGALGTIKNLVGLGCLGTWKVGRWIWFFEKQGFCKKSAFYQTQFLTYFFDLLKPALVIAILPALCAFLPSSTALLNASINTRAALTSLLCCSSFMPSTKLCLASASACL